MSENNTNKPRNYINGIWIDEKVFLTGGGILKLSILPDKLIESLKTLKKDDKGFARAVISKSKNPKPNSSHFIYEDDFVPNNQNKRSVIDKKEAQPLQSSGDDNCF